MLEQVHLRIVHQREVHQTVLQNTRQETVILLLVELLVLCQQACQIGFVHLYALNVALQLNGLLASLAMNERGVEEVPTQFHLHFGFVARHSIIFIERQALIQTVVGLSCESQSSLVLHGAHFRIHLICNQ